MKTKLVNTPIGQDNSESSNSGTKKVPSSKKESESESSDSESSDSEDEPKAKLNEQLKKSEKMSTDKVEIGKKPNEEVRTKNSEKKKKRKRKRQPKNKNKLPKSEMEVVEMAPAQISLEKVDGKQKQKVIKKPTKNEFSSPSNKNSKNHIFFEEEETCKSSSSPSHLTLETAPSTSDNIGTRVQSKASTNVVVRAPSNPKVASKVANAKLVTVTTNDVSEVLPNPKVNGKVTNMKPVTVKTMDVNDLLSKPNLITNGINKKSASLITREKPKYVANSEEVSCEQMILGQVSSLKPVKIASSQNAVAVMPNENSVKLPNGNHARLPIEKPANGASSLPITKIVSSAELVKETFEAAANVEKNKSNAVPPSRSVSGRKRVQNTSQNHESIIENLLSLANSGSPLRGSRQRKSDVWSNRSVILENISDQDPPEHPESTEEHPEETKESAEPHSYGDITSYPLLKAPPAEDSIIAFKVLEMSTNYSPGNFKSFVYESNVEFRHKSILKIP
jgi:hypothetical protein